MRESVGSALVNAPADEPISLDEMKAHLRVDHTDDDVLIGTIRSTVRSYVENITGRAFVGRTLDESFEDFPSSNDDGFLLSRAPVRSVTSVTYHDEDLSTTSTVSSSNYQVDATKSPAELVLKNGQTWPTDTLRLSSGVVIRYVAGYEVVFTAAASDTITAAGHWFSDGDVVRVRASGGSDAALPAGLSADTDYYVISASGSTFELSATSGGSAVDVTGTGTGTFFVGDRLSPPDLRAYMLVLAATMYDHRSTEVTGAVVNKMKYADGLLDPYRMHWF